MTALWIHDGGRIACVPHMGAEGESAARARPNARLLRTPLGSWDRVDDDVRAEWLRQMGTPIACESCPTEQSTPREGANR